MTRSLPLSVLRSLSLAAHPVAIAPGSVPLRHLVLFLQAFAPALYQRNAIRPHALTATSLSTPGGVYAVARLIGHRHPRTRADGPRPESPSQTETRGARRDADGRLSRPRRSPGARPGHREGRRLRPAAPARRAPA